MPKNRSSRRVKVAGGALDETSPIKIVEVDPVSNLALETGGILDDIETDLAAIQSALASLPGTGTASEATLALIRAKTDNLDITLSALASALESITVQSSALPTGASTEATLALIRAKTDNLDITLSALASALESITVQSSALPTGASTEATLALIRAKTDNLDITLSALASALESVTIGTALPTGSNTIGKVDQGLAHATEAWRVNFAKVAPSVVIDRNSSVGGQQLLAAQTFTSAWFDMDGYGALMISCIDNTGGGAGDLRIEWSTDGGTTSPGTFTILGNGAQTVNVTGELLLARRHRYFRISYVNGAIDQGTVSPNVFILTVALFPAFNSERVIVANLETNPAPVRGSADAPATAGAPVPIGGVDSISSPSYYQVVLVDASGRLAITGLSSVINSGNFLLTASRGSSSATKTNVAAAAASTQLAASATGRRGFEVHNDSTEPLYINEGATASATAFTKKVEPGESWRMPDPIFTGVMNGFAEVATGTWRVTTL